MTASNTKRTVRRERRIIERPRLIKLLDESEARIILLLAPAGYGKTTLARQWAKTLNGAIWVSLTPAHRDVARIAETIAAGVDKLGGDAQGFISEFLRAKGNPQHDGRAIADALAQRFAAARVQWIVLDDYHEIDDTPEITEFLAILRESVACRVLVTARVRPSWATHRRTVYGEIFEVTRDALAMDDNESRQLLGTRRDLRSFVTRAEGWPAVLSLAATVSAPPPPENVLPAALYAYLADEIYRSAPLPVQELLLELALAPELTDGALPEGGPVMSLIRDLGFLSVDQTTDLHPLIREFLLQKLAATRSADASAREAVATCIASERWDRAFELVLRFKLNDLTQEVLEASYSPLIRSGHLGTLLAFANASRPTLGFPKPVVDLVDAEVALRDGAFQLASGLAKRGLKQLPKGHRLMSRANTIIGQAALIEGLLDTAVASYRAAHETAVADDDQADALYGWAISFVQGEVGDSRGVVERLARDRHRSPLQLVRFGCVDLAARRFGTGFRDMPSLDEIRRALPGVEDPLARSSFAYSATYTLSLQAEYQDAHRMAEYARDEVETYGLDFVRPHIDWNLAFVNLGLRRFGATDRYLQLVEDVNRDRLVGLHVLNARMLRMRLSLQTGEFDRALHYARSPEQERAIPSLHGEYLATQALCLALASQDEDAGRIASAGESLTNAVEVRVLAQAVRAVVGASRDDAKDGIALFALAEELGTWDPVVVVLRSSERLRDVIAGLTDLRTPLEALYSRSGDRALARRAGFRTRSSNAPNQVLTPREIEVLELMSRGFRNRDISKALVIADSTTKVHVRHILEKLGVRTRAEAVARLQMFR